MADDQHPVPGIPEDWWRRPPPQRINVGRRMPVPPAPDDMLDVIADRLGVERDV
jgi:hypothetical protein